MHIHYFLSRRRTGHLVCYLISCTLAGNSDMYFFTVLLIQDKGHQLDHSYIPTHSVTSCQF